MIFDENGDVDGWTFNSYGNCIQTQYNQDFNWNWNIENEQLKLFVPGGNPAYYTYKIENNA